MPERARAVVYVLDSEGRPIPTATITLRQSGTTTNITETIYANDDPDTSQLTNGAFFSGADGKVVFYLTDQKRLDMLVTKSGYTSQTIPIDVQKSTLVSGYGTVQDEGTGLTQRATLNFTGAGVTATDDAANGRTNVTIAAGDIATSTFWDAAGDLAKGTGADTAARLARGTALQVLRTNAGATDIEWGVPVVGDLLDWQFVRKTTDESVTSSTTLQNDDALLFALSANHSWSFHFVLFYACANATADLKVSLTSPAGSTLAWGITGLLDTVTSDNGDAKMRAGLASGDAIVVGTTSSTGIAQIHGVVLNGGTTGDLQLQWAQNTSDASAVTMKAQSFIELKRFA